MVETSRYPQTMIFKSTGVIVATLLVVVILAMPAGALSATGDGAAAGPTYFTPKTTITFGPAAKTRKREVSFRFTDATEQAGTKFACKLDGQSWKGCKSPRWLKKLSPGHHIFAVKGVNKVGEWDEDPAKRSFKVIG